MNVLFNAVGGSVLLGGVLLAQSLPLACDSSVQFVDHNMVDYTVKVRAMRGKIVDANGAKVGRSCLALFNADHSKLLSTFQANDDGEFSADGIKNGDYWLVVRDPQVAFCPAAARINLRTMNRKSRIIVDMRFQGLDTCSSCEAK
jgi:hypothetical protein